jgi:cytochrome c551/c552
MAALLGLDVCAPMRSHILTVFALSTAALFACGGGAQPAATPPSAEIDASAPKETTAEAGAPSSSNGAGATGTNNAAASGPATTEPSFDSLPKDKKVEVMVTKVVPSVGKLFKEHDGAKFGKFGCASCHGPQKKDDPHKVLPKLTFSNGGYEKLSKAKPEMMKFMGEKVVPAMATALGEQPFDPATKKGFGCAGCHTID